MKAFLCRSVHFFRIKQVVPALIALRGIHCGIGCLQQAIKIIRIVRIERDANTGFHLDRLPGQYQGLRQCLLKLSGNSMSNLAFAALI